MYIQSAEQISIQEPLSDAWFDNPLIYNRVYTRSIEPNYRQYIEANKSRRMGKILKRAIVTARVASQNSGIATPDAIICGTGLGCIENTEIFLKAMVCDGENMLQPTYFMQSTHNTIASYISIDLQSHGYNCTYTHKGVSFENALLDAFMQFKDGRIKTALVCGHDEMTANYQLLLSRIAYWRAYNNSEDLQHGKEAFAGEASVAFMLSSEKNENSICKIAAVELSYKPSKDDFHVLINKLLTNNNLSMSDIDAVLVGVSGNNENDDVYYRMISTFFNEKTLMHYKHIFGETYTASALATYVAAKCLQKNCIPEHLILGKFEPIHGVKNILLYNHSEDKVHTLTLLTAC
jgi:3-oxoacyl-(acyl-carrier-protein) synthase